MPQPTKGTKICVDLALLGMSSLHNCTTQAACKKGFAKSAGAAGRPGNQKKLVSCAAVCGQNWFPGWLVLGFGRSEKCVQMRSILLNIFGFLAHILGFLTQSCAGGFWFFYWLPLFFLISAVFFWFSETNSCSKHTPPPWCPKPIVSWSGYVRETADMKGFNIYIYMYSGYIDLHATASLGT